MTAPAGKRPTAWPFAALAGAWLATAAATVLIICSAPWLGIEVKPGGSNGVLVMNVHPGAPAASVLERGDHITAVRGEGFSDLVLKAADFDPIPYYIRTYSEADAFMARQGEIAHRLEQGPVALVLLDGRVVPIQARPKRPWTTLPALVPIQLAFAALVLALAAGVLRRRSQDPAAQYLCVVAVGYALMVSAHAIYASREFALPTAIFRSAVSVQFEAGLLFVAAGMTAALWHYPARLAAWNFPAWLFGACTLVVVVNEARWVDSLVLGVDGPLYAVLAVMIAIALAQWRRARGRIAHRAVLKWLFIPWFLSLALYYGLHLLPISAGRDPVLSQTIAWAFLPLNFLGVALGVTRFRLFYLNPANLKAWLASGAIFVAMALTALDWLAWLPSNAVLAALVVSGFGFQPLLRFFAHRSGQQYALAQHVVPAMLERALKTSGLRDVDSACRAALEDLFHPLESSVAPAISAARVVEDGEMLITPALPGGSSLILRFPYGGTGLFRPDDALLTGRICDLFGRVAEYWREHEVGRLNERQRLIQRLKSGLGASVASLATEPLAPGQAAYAQWALSAYNAVLDAFSGDPIDLRSLARNLHRELESRCSDAGLVLEWRAELPPVQLHPATALNVRRVVCEATSNAIRHSAGSRLRVSATLDPSGLEFTVEDDGEGRPEALQAGNGLRSMSHRAGLLAGTLRFDRGDLGGLRAHLQIPVTQTGDVPALTAA